MDKAKRRARWKRHRDKKKIEKYGIESLGINMSGRHGNHARGQANARWKGGRFITSHGYVAVRVPPDHPHAWGAHPTVKYAYEHILVMEEFLGRSLTDDEIVHHGKEGKQINLPHNLTVQTRSNHARHHDSERGRDELGRFPPADQDVREFPSG
jgi:hypothetical protein